jgi:hypothetical protein
MTEWQIVVIYGFAIAYLPFLYWVSLHWEEHHAKKEAP